MSIQIHRLQQVMAITGLSRASIYARMQKGTFPSSIKLSEKSVGWRSDDIESWIESLAYSKAGEEAHA